MLADNPVVIDYETIELLPDGTSVGSTDFYKPTFRVDSCAFCERRGSELYSWFVDGEDKVREELRKLGNRPVIVHNYQFELGVTTCRFPNLKLNWYADTMRLVQNYDNGGGDDAFERIVLDPEDFTEEELEEEENIKFRPLSGFGLAISCKRILGLEDHKKEAHDWIYTNVPGVRKGRAGGYLNQLPPDILERYNRLDVERTMQLYEHCTESFMLTDFDWLPDHALYFNTTRFLVESKIRGVHVNRDGVLAGAEAVLQEIEEIGKAFKERFAKEIAKVERARLLKRIRKLKTLKGRKNFVRKVRADPTKWEEEIAFNVGSNAQLQALFVDVMQMQAKFFTAKGSPAFKSAHLHQWGDGGAMLGKRRKRLLVLKQLCNIYKATAFDGKLHIDIKACGTATSRMAGGIAQ